jgi:hypothetical protein
VIKVIDNGWKNREVIVLILFEAGKVRQRWGEGMKGLVVRRGRYERWGKDIWAAGRSALMSYLNDSQWKIRGDRYHDFGLFIDLSRWKEGYEFMVVYGSVSNCYV